MGDIQIFGLHFTHTTNFDHLGNKKIKNILLFFIFFIFWQRGGGNIFFFFFLHCKFFTCGGSYEQLINLVWPNPKIKVFVDFLSYC